MEDAKLSYRFLSRFIIEADTPLAIGSGDRDIFTDRLVVTDVNGLPYIPGTTLAGVLRDSVQYVNKNEIFGFHSKEDGKGSRLILSSAHIIGKDGKVIIDGLKENVFKNEFMAHFQQLPVRQHVRISHKGTAEQGGKFDEQVVYKGTRFGFEMELVGDEKDKKVWETLCNEFTNPAFRLGSGTRKGFGAIKVNEVKSCILDLNNEKELDQYLEKKSNLNDEFWNDVKSTNQEVNSSNWVKYEITLYPDDFFLFGSGFGNEDGSADMTFVTEKTIDWSSGEGMFTNEKILIPATSVKGALAHRTAFHYNAKIKLFADKLMDNGILEKMLEHNYSISSINNLNSNTFEDRIKMATEGNPAVHSLFGYSANDNEGKRGNVIFSDLFLSIKSKENQKLLNHVAIDRFTGGAMDGALFSEEVTEIKEKLDLKIYVNKTEVVIYEYLKAFEKALDDLCSGRLPLGGGTMRGHGCFHGTWTKIEGGTNNG